MGKMKRLIVVGISLLAMVLCVLGILFAMGVFDGQPVDENVLAKVGKVTITRQQVEDRIRFNTVENKAHSEYLTNNIPSVETQQELYQKVEGAVDQDGALKELVEEAVLCQQAEKEGILVSREKAKEYFAIEFSELKTDDSQKDFYKSMQMSFSLNDMSEEEYIGLGEDYSYGFYNRTVMKQHFRKDKGLSGDEDPSNQQFAQYVAELVEKSRVKYF
jgi:hypothetical protein